MSDFKKEDKMFDSILWVEKILILVSSVLLVGGFLCLISSLKARNQNISKKIIGWKLIKIAFIMSGVISFYCGMIGFICNEIGEAISFTVMAIILTTIFTEKLSIGNLIGLKMANLLVGHPPYNKE
ncbi:MAG: hypothetical protein WC697_00075 [Patescibacteria group bacterium]